MSTATKGRAAEHEFRAILETNGYTVIRAAGSKGAADLIAFKPNHVAFVQVKAGRSSFGPAEHNALVTLAACLPRIGVAVLAERRTIARKVTWTMHRLTGPRTGGAVGNDREPWVMDEVWCA